MDCCEPNKLTACAAACCVTKSDEPIAPQRATRFDARDAAIEELVAAIAGAGWTKERMS